MIINKEYKMLHIGYFVVSIVCEILWGADIIEVTSQHDVSLSKEEVVEKILANHLFSALSCFSSLTCLEIDVDVSGSVNIEHDEAPTGMKKHIADVQSFVNQGCSSESCVAVVFD